MCYAIPGKVISVDGKHGVITYFGETQRVLLDLVNAKVGDYVFAQGGIGISIMNEQEALTTLDIWKDLFASLKDVDAEFSEKISITPSKQVQGIIRTIMTNGDCSDEDAVALLELTSDTDCQALFQTANQVRWKAHGNASCVHGILEFSNYCRCACAYCGIQVSREIRRYRMSASEIVAAATDAVKRHQFRAILVQSGEDLFYDDDELESIVKQLRALDILVFVSLGMRNFSTYKRLYDAGARAVLLRFESSNAELFSSLRTDTTLMERLELIRALKSHGFILATGFIIGLPGETPLDVVRNIRLTKSLKPDMYSFGPFIPATGTALSNHSSVTLSQVLKTTAVARLMDNPSNILVTTALETLAPEGARTALLSGANSMMINVTPPQFKELYSIYDRRASAAIPMDTQIANAIRLLGELGRSPMDIGVNQ